MLLELYFMEIFMGIHHDYKSKRGERAMAKQQKREAKFSDNADKKEEENSQYFNNLREEKFKTIFSETVSQSESFDLFISSSFNWITTLKKSLK